MKFSSKLVWNLLLGVSGAAALWFGSNAIAKSIMYNRFSNEIIGNAFQWSVIHQKENRYQVCVDYSFYLNSQNIHSRYFYSKQYRTLEAAEDSLDSIKTAKVNVYYWEQSGSKQPLSILERVFPTSEWVRFILCFTICLYFWFLKRHFAPILSEKVSLKSL